MIIGLVVVVVSIVTVLLRGTGQSGALDPGSFAPSGSHALARLIEAQGVHIDVVHTAGDATRAAHAGGDATLLITLPDLLVPEQLATLGHGIADLVVVAPHEDAVVALSPSVHTAGETPVVGRSPNCSVEALAATGTATMGGVLYQTTGDAQAQRCYPAGDAASLLQLSTGGATITFLGTGTPLTNHDLAQRGNAAVAMRLLGKHQRLVWYVPSLSDPSLSEGQRSFYDLLPRGGLYGLAQVAVAVMLLALWRARRLGAVVTEPLPVVVRAAETVEGRARLYRRARASDHAAFALRQAARERLVSRVGLATATDPAALLDAVAHRVGRSAAEVHSLLYGPAPADDAALVRLADALDALEKEVSGI